MSGRGVDETCVARTTGSAIEVVAEDCARSRGGVILDAEPTDFIACDQRRVTIRRPFWHDLDCYSPENGFRKIIEVTEDKLLMIVQFPLLSWS